MNLVCETNHHLELTEIKRKLPFIKGHTEGHSEVLAIICSFRDCAQILHSLQKKNKDIHYLPGDTEDQKKYLL